MHCSNSTCHKTVGQPYIRLASGERGGPANYEEFFVCSWNCAYWLSYDLQIADHCNEEIGYHSIPHTDCILR